MSRSSAFSFLRESSIHGLRYLVEARNPLVKLTWLALIATSMSFAGIIVYKNWTEWRDSPSVVTSVRPSMASDVATLPMVAVCPPHSPSSPALIHRLLGRESERSDFVLDQVVDELRLSLLKRGLVERCDSSRSFDRDLLYDVVKVKTEECFEGGKTNSSELVSFDDETGCGLLRALGLLASVQYGALSEGMSYYRKRKLKTGGAVRTFLEEAGRQEPILTAHPSTEDMMPAAESRFNVFGIDEQPIEREVLSRSSSIQEFLVAYNCLFPLPKGDQELKDELRENFPRPLSDFDFSWVPDVEKKEAAELFLAVADRGISTMSFSLDLRRDVVLSLLGSASDMLGIEEQDGAGRTFRNQSVYGVVHSHPLVKLTNAFHFDHFHREYISDDKFFFDFSLVADEMDLADVDDSYFHPCGHPANASGVTFEGVCKANAGKSEVCSEYCEMVEKALDGEQEAKLRQLYEMGLDAVGPPVEGLPGGSLPLCQKPGEWPKAEGCWEKIVNEKGMCYISEASSLVPRQSDDVDDAAFTANDFLFVFDASPSPLMAGTSDDRDPYLCLLPPNNFATGRSTDAANVLRYADYTGWDAEVSVNYISVGTDEFKAISPDRRGCLYPHEKKLEHFPAYSEANCYLERAWDLALRTCLCAPWTHAALFPGVAACEVYGNWCFRKVVDSRFSRRTVAAEGLEAACPRDCEDVDFSVTWTKVHSHIDPRIDETELRTRKNLDPRVVEMADIIEPYNLSRSIFLQGRVFLSTKKSLVITQTASATTVDMISNIGGTFGLFCGFSILSLAEIFYWFGKEAMGKKRRRGKGRGRRSTNKI